ncbi:MAG TPA: protein kinase [Bryobacteraceae bacterium]|nr:protein kinase [Bryobacteraceae bacterium]
MSYQLPPWWICLGSFAFMGQFVLTAYSTLWTPKFIAVTGRDRGLIRYEFRSNELVVTGVQPDSSFDRAGVRVGDHVVRIDSEPVPSVLDLTWVLANLDIGKTYRLQIRRQGQSLEVSVPFTQHPIEWSGLTIAQAAILSSQLFMLLLGLGVVFVRPYDPAAHLGALMLATFGAMFFIVPGGMVSIWRGLPFVAGALLWIPRCAMSVVGAIVFVFCTHFPKRLFPSKWVASLAIFPAAVDGVGDMTRALAMYHYPTKWETLLHAWPPEIHFPIQAAYALAGLVAMGVNYNRMADQNERRRIRIIFAGLGVTVVSTVPVPISDYVSINSSLREFFLSPGYAIARAVLSTLAPTSIAYAILRHRLFDIRIIVRRGLQYALARGAMAAAVPALGAIFIADLVWHGAEPLGSILKARGGWYVGLGAAALLAHRNRQRWLETLDRKFFREQYDARRLILEVVGEIGAASSIDHVASKVTSKIESALHPEFTALMMRRPNEAQFRTVAVAPADRGPQNLPAEGKLVVLARVLGKPVQCQSAGRDWLEQQLPRDELRAIRQAGIEVLVPVTKSLDQREALLVLGTKRSEEPYSADDLELLMAIGASLALLLDKGISTPRSAPEVLSQGATESLEQSLAAHHRGRYQVMALVGAGGMGKVYRARDTRLNRTVALKVAAEQFSERFEREARAVAALNHPNICQLYDIGPNYLVMEYVDGVTIRSPLQVDQALEIAIQIASALDAAHVRGIVHRDIKPGNILVTPQGQVKVLDFGLALQRRPGATGSTEAVTIEMITTPGSVMGTAAYMSPEQARGQDVDARTDLWSFGVVLYEMITGKRPFEGETVPVVFGAVLNHEPRAIRDHNPSVSLKLEQIVIKLLSKDRESRYPSAADLRADLKQVCEE